MRGWSGLVSETENEIATTYRYVHGLSIIYFDEGLSNFIRIKFIRILKLKIAEI